MIVSRRQIFAVSTAVAAAFCIAGSPPAQASPNLAVKTLTIPMKAHIITRIDSSMTATTGRITVYLGDGRSVSEPARLASAFKKSQELSARLSGPSTNGVGEGTSCGDAWVKTADYSKGGGVWHLSTGWDSNWAAWNYDWTVDLIYPDTAYNPDPNHQGGNFKRHQWEGKLASRHSWGGGFDYTVTETGVWDGMVRGEGPDGTLWSNVFLNNGLFCFPYDDVRDNVWM
ncbi:hypothetical protein ACIBHX_52015 [Nonomuraea sp. NPDC050536]|uniref:hypothetical protein n=1 Tax=Nonomuraea sp. NPDC050536 TaxID=3364366 RepID=UPI0037C91171